METEQEIADREEAAKLKLEQETSGAEEKLDSEGNPIEAELDEDGKPIKAELETWQQTEEAGGSDDVPVGTHIRMKDKLKGRIKERDTELDKLRAENETLRQAKPPKSTELPPRPKAIDFDSDEEHEAALGTWEEKRLDARFEQREVKTQQGRAANQYQENLATAVDGHYERSAKLVEDSGMSSDLFKESDTLVRQAVESIMPDKGDPVTDHIISLLGEGSEKVMFFLGRNKAALSEFKGLLAEDNTGMKALVYLGQQKERLTNPKRKTSTAPKPANDAKGDITANQTGDALKRKYDKAHKNGGGGQAAYNIKKEARKSGVDVSSW